MSAVKILVGVVVVGVVGYLVYNAFFKKPSSATLAVKGVANTGTPERNNITAVR